MWPLCYPDSNAFQNVIMWLRFHLSISVSNNRCFLDWWSCWWVKRPDISSVRPRCAVSFWNSNCVGFIISYRQVSNIRRTKSQQLKFLVLSCGCLCRIPWSQILSREWRCSWGSADRQCSNYIWVIDNFIAYQGASYIRGFTVFSSPSSQAVSCKCLHWLC